jgi:ABC-type sugar transport system permease subunit
LLFILAPAAIVFFIVFMPAAAAIALSFMQWTTLDNMTPVGIGNYIEIFNAGFIEQIAYILKLAFCTALSVNIIGFILAFLLARSVKISGLFKAAVFAPGFFPTVAVASIVQIFFVGLMPSLNLSSGALFPTFETFIGANWHLIGFMIVLYFFCFAKLRSYKNLLDAAKIDGLSGFKVFFQIRLWVFWPALVLGFVLIFLYMIKFLQNYMTLFKNPPQTLTSDIYLALANPNLISAAQAKSVVFFILSAFFLLIGIMSFYRASKKGLI